MSHSLFIGGEWTAAQGDVFSSHDPASTDVLWQGAAATAADVDAAMQAAHAAFDGWAMLPLAARIAHLEAYRSVIESRQETLAETIARETGKPLWDARGEARAVAAKIAISIAAHHERSGEKTASAGAMRQELRHRPHGVMAIFGPYNFPVHLPNGHLVPALLAGNTAVFKPSEETPASGAFMVECWRKAGLPAGVLNLVQGARATGEALVAHPGLAGVLFTGSYATGQAIHRALAGRSEVMLALEMGGNNPLIVHDAADTGAAVRLTLQSAYLSAGQRCTCARRLIVPEGAAGDRFVAALAESLPRLVVGAWNDSPEPFMGPLVNMRQADGVLAAQSRLIEQGAVAIVETRRLREERPFLSPGLIDVTVVKKRPDEEIFGPLLQLIRTPDVDAALGEANATAFGLAAGLISDDAVLWERFRTTIRAGIVNWNRPLTGASSAAPFGGPGKSGNGRPSAYYAADYCAYPTASLAADRVQYDEPMIGYQA